MLEPTEILMLVVLPLLLGCSAFFSGGETAVFSLTRHQRLQLSRSKTVASRIITSLTEDRQSVLATLLLGNMFVNVLYFVIGTVLVLMLTERAVLDQAGGGVFNAIAFVLLILLGEVLPKLIASRFAVTWARTVAVPLMIIYRFLTPPRTVLQFLLVDPISRLIAPTHRPEPLTTGELQAMLDLSEKRGVIDQEEERMLQHVLLLGQMKLASLMTPRVEIVSFDLDDDPEKLLPLVRDSPYSRIPVCRGDIDHIEGFVYARQVLLTRPTTSAAIESLIRSPWLVPELKSAGSLLVDMRRHGLTTALAVDEYGGTAGIITLEDLVEHIVGALPESHDAPPPPQVEVVGEREWRVGAGLSIDEWIEAFGRIHRVPGIHTVGGLVMAMLGRIPQVGDQTKLGNLLIEVETMNGRRIESLHLRLQEDASPDPEAMHP